MSSKIKKTTSIHHRPLTDEDLRAASGGMFDAYLQIDGIKGESQEDKHKDWIEVLSYSHKVSQPTR